MFKNIVILFLIILPAAFVGAHGEPEKVADNKYLIVLSFIPGENDTRLRFFFSDINTGRYLTTPVLARISILDDESKELTLVEVAFLRWTRHNLLRQGRFLGVRDDKVPHSVGREETTSHQPTSSSAPRGKHRSL